MQHEVEPRVASAAGSGFGLRGEQDVVEDAVILSKTLNRPVKVIRTCEDDFANGRFRLPFADMITDCGHWEDSCKFKNPISPEADGAIFAKAFGGNFHRLVAFVADIKGASFVAIFGTYSRTFLVQIAAMAMR